MIRLFAFDLDGTTITEHKYLSEENRSALVEAGRSGVILVPTTGRMRAFLPEEIVSLPGVRYVITCNGAAAYDLGEGKPLFRHLISNEAAREVQRILEDYDIYVEYYREGKAVTMVGYPELAFTHFGLPESKRHFVDSKEYALTESFDALLETGLCPEKINLPYASEAVRAQLWQRLSNVKGIRLTSSIPDNIEINSDQADKGRALLELAGLLGIDREEIAAIGDNINDVPMLNAVGCSAAVGDGSPEALAAARHIVASHDRNGVAEALKRFVLAPSG